MNKRKDRKQKTPERTSVSDESRWSDTSQSTRETRKGKPKRTDPTRKTRIRNVKKKTVR